jgi:hypothetical protein
MTEPQGYQEHEVTASVEHAGRKLCQGSLEEWKKWERSYFGVSEELAFSLPSPQVHCQSLFELWCLKQEY